MKTLAVLVLVVQVFTVASKAHRVARRAEREGRVFPVLSSSVQTPQIERANRVMGRTKVAPKIYQAGVYACRKISGSSSWSQHSWGNASDLFTRSAEANKLVANAIVYQAKHRTKANRLRKLDVRVVIDHENQRQWVKGSGWGPYGGARGLHVHAEGDPKKTGQPGCA